MVKLNNEEIPVIIGSFLKKHAGNREKVKIHDYEFDVNSIYHIEINKKSIHELENGDFQFNGSALIVRTDPKSKITTKNVKSTFHGVAFFANDVEGESILMEVDIDQIKNLE